MSADAQAVAFISGLVGIVAIIVAVFRFGRLTEAIEKSVERDTERFANISEKFTVIATQSAALAELAKLVAAASPRESAWKATTDTRLNAIEEDIEDIRDRLHKLANALQSVVSRLDIAAAQHLRAE